MKSIPLLHFLKAISTNKINFKKEFGSSFVCISVANDSEEYVVSTLKSFLKKDLVEFKPQQNLFGSRINDSLKFDENKIYIFKDISTIDIKNSLNQEYLKNTCGIIFIYDKLTKKEEAYFDSMDAIKIEMPKLFLFKDFYPLICKIQNKPIKKDFFSAFESLKCESLVQVQTLIDISFVLSLNNINLFKKEYFKLESTASFFTLPGLLFQENNLSTSKFFKAWDLVKNDFPIQFWTVFFMNKAWSMISENNIKNLNKYKKLFKALYLADFDSKTLNSQIYLEPIFYEFLK